MRTSKTVSFPTKQPSQNDLTNPQKVSPPAPPRNSKSAPNIPTQQPLPCMTFFSDHLKVKNSQSSPSATEHKIKNSSHDHTIVLNTAKRDRQDIPEYILKFLPQKSANDPEKTMAELEVVAANWGRLLTPECVPSTKAVYDSAKKEFIGVLSKKFPHFKTNKEDPLTEADLLTINFNDKRVSEEKTNISNYLDEIKALYTKPEYTTETWGQLFQSMTSYAMISKTFKNKINIYIKTIGRFSPAELTAFKISCQQRKQHIITSNDEKKYENEIFYIDKTIASIDYLLKDPTQAMIKLAEINKHILELEKMGKINLNQLKDTDEIEGEITNSQYDLQFSFKISVNNIKRYRTQWGQGRHLTMRRLNQEGDMHNRNMSKKGEGIDYDMAMLLILWYFRINTYSDQKWRIPNEQTFTITSKEAHDFPNLTCPNLGYWPTMKTYLTQSVITNIQLIYDIAPNFFTESDHTHYSKLHECPVFTAANLTTILKELLTTENMFRENAKLYIRENVIFNKSKEELLPIPGHNQFNGKTLIQVLTENQMQTYKTIEAVYYTMPEFKNFLKEQGDYFFHEIIKPEFAALKAKHERKIKENRSSEAFINTLNLEDLESRYIALYTRVTGERHKNAEIRMNSSFKMTA